MLYAVVSPLLADLHIQDSKESHGLLAHKQFFVPLPAFQEVRYIFWHLLYSSTHIWQQHPHYEPLVVPSTIQEEFDLILICFVLIQLVCSSNVGCGGDSDCDNMN